MKLWLISQSVNNGYDTYDSAVVAAKTEEEARVTCPSSYSTKWSGTKWLTHLNDGRILELSSGAWCDPKDVEVMFLSNGYKGEVGVILASFNAG